MKKFIAVATCVIMVGGCNNNPGDHVVQQENDTSNSTDASVVAKDTVASSNDHIEPGVSIGNITLGEDAALLDQKLGKPDSSDAAMGKAWLTWFGKKKDEHNNRTELNVYTAYKDTSMNGKSVQQLRTTSSFFKTVNGIHVYTGFDSISKNHAIKQMGHYTANDGRDMVLYDDTAKGIAFEFVMTGSEKICTGIILHQPGKSVLDIYITLHPDINTGDIK